MNCKEQTRWQAMIIDRLADELSEEDAVLLEQHLGECESCMREAQVLTGVLRTAAEAEEWQPNPALEARLAAALHDLQAGAGLQMATGVDPGAPTVRSAVPPAPRRGWLASLANLGFRPLPFYAAAALVLVAAAAGFWTGRGQPGETATGTHRADAGWSQVPSDTSRMSVPPAAGEPGTALLPSSPSFAAADPGARLRATSLQFVTVRSDAVDLPGLMLADSL